MSDHPHGEHDAETPGGAPDEGPHEIHFVEFVMSLATSALLHLGESEDHHSTGGPVNLPLAKQTIEILGMLHEKTRGNLDLHEQRAIEGVLYDLRMRYLQASGGAAAKSKR